MNKPTTKQDVLETVVKILQRHSLAIDTISQGLISQACILAESLVKCDACEDVPATMQHYMIPNKLFCDKCCATVICDKTYSYPKETSNPDSWIHMQNADQTRHVIELISASESLSIIDKKRKFAS